MYVGQTTPRVDPNPFTPELSPSSSEQGQTEVHFRRSEDEFTNVPALVKIFDEILVNASDNHQRNPKTCRNLSVTIHPGSKASNPVISVRNDGPGIPVAIHSTEQLWIPEMLFGHLLTGSNFRDSEARTTGGRHGYGAKLTNIFSRRFDVMTADADRGLVYRQGWTDNMRAAGDPVITPITRNKKDGDNGEGAGPRESCTAVRFEPDVPKLCAGMEDNVIPEGDYKAMTRRVAEVAGTNPGLSVTLNGVPLEFGSFEDFCGRFMPEGEGGRMAYAKVNSRWEVAVSASRGGFQQVSYVNSIATPLGGTHVNYVSSAVAKMVAAHIARTHKDLSPTAGQVKQHMMLFVNCTVEDPNFDSQMKENLTSPPSTWGSTCLLPESLCKEIVAKTPLVSDVVAALRRKDSAETFNKLKPNAKKVGDIAKLDDANLAGTADSGKCTLILTEGDSAKALAVSGLEALGRSKFGVFPLRGKVLNVRDVSVRMLLNNEEIKNLTQIVGLDFRKDYVTDEEFKTLRYGRVMIMTDQDNDGSHIKGLIMNLFRCFWPELLKRRPEFLSQFVTPILKAKRGREVKSFYSLGEYLEWKQDMSESEKKEKWTVKYYKGLGTNTAKEGKEYFNNIGKHHKLFSWEDEMDGETLDMAFDKNRAEDRRDWILTKFDPTEIANFGERVPYKDFVDKELIHFSNADNVRSIPNVVDGLKPSQRKVLYSCFKRNLKGEIKVAQLAGYIAEHTAYHHGEQSLHMTIINMAQDFMGSNNLPLLVPSGQFGTRLSGGKDSASPRYIFTRLQKFTRALFPEMDDSLLPGQEDDGQIIEPKYFAPIIPLLLINGGQGIGTGWSTLIPTFDPREVSRRVRERLDGVESEGEEMFPWVRGFKGTWEKNTKRGSTGFTSRGVVKQGKKRGWIEIVELPVGVWTSSYKEFLVSLRSKGVVKSFTEHHTTKDVRFVVQLHPSDYLDLWGKKGENKAKLIKKFKLESHVSTNNMNAFNGDGNIVKYESAENVIDDFFPVRLGIYEKRKLDLERKMSYDAKYAQNKARFIEEVISGDVVLFDGKRSKAEVVDSLKDMNFDTKESLDAILGGHDDEAVVVAGTEGNDTGDLEEDSSANMKSFDYLLSTNVSAFTTEQITKHKADKDALNIKLDELQKTSKEDMWRADLDRLDDLLEKWCEGV